MAANYLGNTFSIAPFIDITGPERSRVRSVGIFKLCFRTIADGCIGEAFAARILELDVASATDGVARANLRAILADEKQHELLSWSIVEWCLSEMASWEKRILVRSLSRIRDKASKAESPGRKDAMMAHGRFRDPRVSDALYVKVRQQGLERVAKAA